MGTVTPAAPEALGITDTDWSYYSANSQEAVRITDRNYVNVTLGDVRQLNITHKN